jgi:hypothetical protein
VDELPSGTVTFLFTDIEGSTQLLNQLGGDRYAEILEEHVLAPRRRPARPARARETPQPTRLYGNAADARSHILSLNRSKDAGSVRPTSFSFSRLPVTVYE